MAGRPGSRGHVAHCIGKGGLNLAPLLPISRSVKTRVAVLCPSLACATTVEAGLSLWEKAALPAHVRPLVHERAAGVPPFAHEDSLLADPKAWPAAMTLGGKRCVLQITSSNSGSVPATRRSRRCGRGIPARSQVPVPRSATRPGVWAGYFWDGNGRLWARGWTEPDSGAPGTFSTRPTTQVRFSGTT